MISLMDSPWEAETGKTAAAMKKKTKTKYLMGVSGNRRSDYRFVALPGEGLDHRFGHPAINCRAIVCRPDGAFTVL